MVTVIHSSNSLSRALNYNHQKEVQGKATCMLAANYPKEAQEMTFYQKLYRLTNQAALNQRTTVNSVHISLNFDPAEKLSREKLATIAQSYMQKIGFGGQPYLIYEHRDAGHPHLHIVTTNIRADGKRIELHNLGKNQSERARKAIETEFDLVKANTKQQQNPDGLQPVAVKKVVYGQSETRRAISNVLDAVLYKYKFTSLEELNAVLRQANVQATRGAKTSRIYQRSGLLFQVLDEQGKPVGVPIKASSIYSKPTLKSLNKKFDSNANERMGLEKRIKMAVDWYYLKSEQPSLKDLREALGKEGIVMTEYVAKNGQTFGITYVDHQTGAIFKGSDIGKEYTAKGLETRMTQPPINQPVQPETSRQGEPQRIGPDTKGPQTDYKPSLVDRSLPTTDRPSISEPKHETNDLPIHSAGLPYELRTDEKKKKKRKRLRL